MPKILKQTELSIYSRASLHSTLKDVRPRTYGAIFGTVEGIARQYGVKITKLSTCYKFSAPKSRLQMFVEKLHFSKTPYSGHPY